MATTIQNPILTKLLRLEKELNLMFLEREELVRIVILSLLTRHHTLIFGKHGAAKSSLVRAVASAISCECFTIQLGKDTQRDDVFGPIRLSKLQYDQLCRAYERFLPGTPLVFLDEIDKANTVILNALYTAMEERLFLNDGVMIPIPLISLFGAANSISQLQTEALAPLLDRFLFRVEANWIQSDDHFLEFIRRKSEQDAPILTTALSVQEITLLQQQVKQIQFPRDTQEVVLKLRKDLANEDIYASDRRWGYIIDLLKAVAFIEGDYFVAEEHFTVLRHVLWTDTKQIPVIDRILKAIDGDLPTKLKTRFNTAIGRAKKALAINDPQALLGEATLTISDLQSLIGELQKHSGSKIRKALNEASQKVQEIETHRKTICKI